MTLVVEQAYPNGVPQTAVVGWSPRGVAWHWSAGGSGRAGWDGSVGHLIATRLSVNASYHGGFWCEHDAAHRACRTILQWIVPVTKAAHSIAPSQVFIFNTAKDRATQETRFTEVRRILARDNDPNADCIALAYAGMPANFLQDRACPVFRADLQDLARQLVGHPTVIDRPHFGHGWIQPISRYEMDATPTGADMLIGELYSTPPEEDDMYDWVPSIKHHEPVLTVASQGAVARKAPSHSAPAHYTFMSGATPEALADRTIVRLGYVTDAPGYPAGLWHVCHRKGGTALFLVANSQMDDDIGPAYSGPAVAQGYTTAQLQEAERNAFTIGVQKARAAANAAIDAVPPPP